MAIRILQQGHLDGFCLLYAIINAYRALKEPRQSVEKFLENDFDKWKKLIKLTPSLQNFASGEGSHISLRTNSSELAVEKSIISNAFSAFNGNKYFFTVERIGCNQVNSVNFCSSVVIFPTNEKAECKYHAGIDHWMCCVDQDETDFLLACSYTWFLCNKDYREVEKQSVNMKRVYNNKISKNAFNPKTIYEDSVYLISIGCS